MVVDRVEVSALCGMEPFLMLGSVVRIGLPAPFFSSQYGIALVALNVRRGGGGWIPDASPKKSFFLACNFPNVVYSMCVVGKDSSSSQASHKAKESAS